MSSLYIILIFFTALAFSLLSVPLMIRFAHAKKLYDLPDNLSEGRRIHTTPVPRLGNLYLLICDVSYRSY
jgi:UDP-N-acetylmuramyl pentapeptide phosphotransferase/UDP-N-acetylglucosamine-1-phosphate transferase